MSCDGCPLFGNKQVLGEDSAGKLTQVTEKIGGGTFTYKVWEPEPTKDKYRVVFVGIFPGPEEVKLGHPFMGGSGRMLRELANQLGYESCYLTNVLSCELTDDVSDSNRNKAISCCKDRLFLELSKLDPELVVAMGAIPLKVLTGEDYKITEIAGRVIPGLLCSVLPIVNPAAIYRRIEEFPDLVDALRSGKKWLSGDYHFASIPKTVVVDQDNMGEVLQIIENAEVVAIDLETTRRGFYPYGPEADSIRCIALAVDDKTAYIIPGDSSEFFEKHPNYVPDSRVKHVLDRSKLIFHNAQFDCGFLRQAGYTPSIYYDTLLAHYQIDERTYAHGLKHLAKKLLGAADWETGIQQFKPHKKSSYDYIPDDVLYRYASFDVVYTYQLYRALLKDVPVDGDKVFAKLLMPCHNMFSHIRHVGLTIDPRRLMDADKDLTEDIQNSTRDLREMTDLYINPYSPPEVASLIYDKLEFPTIPKFGRSTSKKVLALYQPHPVIDKIIECRELGKLRSTYVASLIDYMDTACRIHPTLKLHGTITGRVSAEDPSVMNIKKDSKVKRMYLPEGKHFILDIDQKQMELRVFALLAEDKVLGDIFSRGEDPHAFIKAKLDAVSGKDWDRGKVKGGVFGGLYGRGEASFMYGFRISAEEARDLKADVSSLFPTQAEYRDNIKSTIHAQGYLESYFGRKRRFPLITNETKHSIYRMGFNFPVQSTASDINLFCMLHLYENRDRLGIMPYFPVHDSIVMDLADKGMISTIVSEVESYSRNLVDGKMDFITEAKVGENWGSLEDVKR